MSGSLTAFDINKFREAFRLFDTKNSGKISQSQLAEVLSKIGYNAEDQEFRTRLNEIDTDGNGEIDFEEFIKVVVESDSKEDDTLKTEFRVFDINNDGFISQQELISVLNTLGMNLNEKQVSDMIQCIDKDGDGRINYNEFLTLNKVFLRK
ncbi:uncharacterized protein LOC130628991 [Hydractinia symbiolongicarpus]|uniref:uncharacterized protein LOC130628991 n=1 Tax=Hydractinia symbiolongicarpus TaxID=13093 RepID=UPI00254D3CD0|nr:uncharacterized protein LOC130628991 [Hydractinia symbiolongicarpus]